VAAPHRSREGGDNRPGIWSFSNGRALESYGGSYGLVVVIVQPHGGCRFSLGFSIQYS